MNRNNMQAVENLHGFALEETCVLSRVRNSEKVYICSPLRADTDNGILNNMSAAGKYAGYALNKLHYHATALHSYLPFVLNDRIPEQREKALRIGLKVLENSDVLMVCGDKISDGMRGEIEYAVKLNKKIVVFNDQIFPQVLDIVSKSGSNQFNVRLDKEHPKMAKPPKEQDYSKWLKLLRWEV